MGELTVENVTPETTSDGTIQMFADIFRGLYDMMRTSEIHVFDIDFTMWDVFMWTLVGGFVVLFLRKFLDL